MAHRARVIAVNLMTRVQFPRPTLWKEPADSFRLSLTSVHAHTDNKCHLKCFATHRKMKR